MQVDFQRTLRGLSHERRSTNTHYLLIGILAALFGGWFAWLSWGRVPLYEVSSSARIETGEHGRPVETVLPGRVARVIVRTRRDGAERRSGGRAGGHRRAQPDPRSRDRA